MAQDNLPDLLKNELGNATVSQVNLGFGIISNDLHAFDLFEDVLGEEVPPQLVWEGAREGKSTPLEGA